MVGRIVGLPVRVLARAFQSQALKRLCRSGVLALWIAAGAVCGTLLVGVTFAQSVVGCTINGTWPNMAMYITWDDGTHESWYSSGVGNWQFFYYSANNTLLNSGAGSPDTHLVCNACGTNQQKLDVLNTISAGWTQGMLDTLCSGGGTCTGNCNYQYLDTPQGPRWSLLNSDCSAVTGCSCPSNPVGGNCPAVGDTVTVGCGSSEASACIPPCTGSCCYVSVADGQGGFVWQSQSDNCTAGANNCGCPSGPGGQCPTSAGEQTCISCGAAGGPCTPLPCSGTCNYTSINDGNGGFAWEFVSSDCRQGVDNCGCPADPGGDCPTGLRQNVSVACGSASVACKKAACSAHGGDADNDGCCADVDADDNDSAVCDRAGCEGTYQRCQMTDPDDETKLIDCDPADPATQEQCRCSRVNNGDRDKDGCCDAVDKWPDDPKKGCECCDYEAAWTAGGGPALQAEWSRIFNQGKGPLQQFVVYNSSTGKYDYAGPAGSPEPVYISIPLHWLSGNRMADMPMMIPVTVDHLETLLTSTGVGNFAGEFSYLDSFRAWWRAGVLVLAFWHLGALIFWEIRY